MRTRGRARNPLARAGGSRPTDVAPKESSAEKGDTAAMPHPTEHDTEPSLSGHEGRINDHARALSEHHDRLTNIEHRLGIKPKVGEKFEDQRPTTRLEPGKKTKEEAARKGTQLAHMYERRRHP